MGFLLLALFGLGAYAVSRSKAGGAAPSGGPPAVDPGVGDNPSLGGPRLQTINGIVAITAPWLEIALFRLTRYNPGPNQAGPVVGSVQSQAALKFTEDYGPKSLPTVSLETLLSRPALLWLQEQNVTRGNAIVVSTSLVTGKFTETSENVGKANPFLPTQIRLVAVPPLLLGSVATAGSGLAVMTAVPGSLSSIDF